MDDNYRDFGIAMFRSSPSVRCALSVYNYYPQTDFVDKLLALFNASCVTERGEEAVTTALTGVNV